MAWVTPKTWWSRVNDRLNYTDVNRIKNNVQAIYDGIIISSSTTSEHVGPLSIKVININYNALSEGQKWIYDITAELNTRTYTIHVVAYKDGYYDVTRNGITERKTGFLFVYGTGENEEGTFTVTTTKAYMVDELFTIKPMFADKVVNDLWYADEINTVLDNLETIAGKVSRLAFNGRPYYGDNSPVPTDIELNIIEGFTLNLYNRIYGEGSGIKLGIEGSVGERITNRLI